MQQSPSISHKTQHIIRCHQKSNDIKAETSDNQNQKHTHTHKTQRFFIWTETGISIKLNGFIRTKTCQTKCKQYLDMTNKREKEKTNQLFDFGFFPYAEFDNIEKHPCIQSVCCSILSGNSDGDCLVSLVVRLFLSGHRISFVFECVCFLFFFITSQCVRANK